MRGTAPVSISENGCAETGFPDGYFDVVIPEIPDAEGIHIVEITNNQLVIEHTRDDDEVYDYIKSFGLTSRPIKLRLNLCLRRF